MTIPKRGAQNIHEHLWLHWRSFLTKKKKLIHSNFWPFPSAERKTFMNIYGFIDNHFWPKEKAIHGNFWPFPSAKRKNIYGNFWLIHDHFWPKKKSFMVIFDHSQARSAKTFMNIYGFIDDHFWPKRKNSFMTRRNFCPNDGNSWQRTFVLLDIQ